MASKKGKILSMEDNNTLFIEDRAFYKLHIAKDHDYMLPRDQKQLPGFYIQVSYDKFLPHMKNTPVSSHATCFTVPVTMPETTNNCFSFINGNSNHGRMVLKKVCSIDKLPKHIKQKMVDRVEEFLKNLRMTEGNCDVLVPVSISIVASLFSPEVKDLFHSWKTKILESHATIS